MLYTTLQVGDKEYKLRLSAKAAVDVERKIGKSLLALFGDGRLNELPNLETLITVLHGSLQAYEHGLSLEDTYEIYDKYIENGGSFTGLIQVLLEVLKSSGFFREAPTGAKKTSK